MPPPPPGMDGPPPGGPGAGGPPPGMGPGGPGGFGKGGFGGKRKPGKQKGRNMVWVSVNGKAAPRPIKIGISDGVNVEILKGLSVGDVVITGQEIETEVKAEKEKASSPFMPGPPGKRKKK